jgi:hypothetical protein
MTDDTDDQHGVDLSVLFDTSASKVICRETSTGSQLPCLLAPLSHFFSVARPPNHFEFSRMFRDRNLDNNPDDKNVTSNHKKNVEYFKHMDHDGRGPQSLISRAISGGDSFIYKNRLHNADSLLVFLIAWLTKTMSARELTVFTQILKYITTTRLSTVSQDKVLPPIPKSIPDCYKYCGQGKDSISRWLPYPTIQKMVNNHIYCSPGDCLRDSLGHGHMVRPFLINDVHRTHAQTPRGNQIIEKAIADCGKSENGEPLCLVCPAYMWFDDYQNDNVKDNRNKIWIMLMSIATPQVMIHTSCQTYVVGLGPGDENHEHVMERFYKDLRLLSGDNEKEFLAYYYP